MSATDTSREIEANAADIPAFIINRRRPSAAWLRERHAARRGFHGSLQEFIERAWVPILGAATNFTLTLDTTAPQGPTFAINGGAAYATSVSATADFSTTDGSTAGYQIKIWGTGIDTAADADVQTTEGASSWKTYTASQAITLTTGDGSKSVSAKIRDDVGNETSTLTDTITLDTTLPVPNITVAASPTKISKIATFDTSTFTFQVNEDVQAWKVKVVPATGSAESAGTLIPTTAGSTNTSGGSLAASTNKVVTIKGTDLETASAGDGAKIVKVFAQDLAGNWSV